MLVLPRTVETSTMKTYAMAEDTIPEGTAVTVTVTAGGAGAV